MSAIAHGVYAEPIEFAAEVASGGSTDLAPSDTRVGVSATFSSLIADRSFLVYINLIAPYFSIRQEIMKI